MQHFKPKKHNQAVKHPGLHKVVIDILYAVFCEYKYADHMLEKTFRLNKRLGSRDRKFVAECVYEIIRNKRILFASLFTNEDTITKDRIERVLLFFLFLENIQEASGFDKALLKHRELMQDAQYRFSTPAWLDAYALNELGLQWHKEAEAMHVQAPVVLRVNTLKTNVPELRNLLEDDGVLCELIPASPDALQLTEKRNVFSLPAFKQGFFEVQDAGSQQIAPFLQVKPGMRVIDACAGGGGKTLHLSALMQNKGQIVALDTEAYKLEQLSKRARRNGVFNVQIRLLENSKISKRLAGTADRLLLDVPCSGSGVFRRNPDAKWKLSEAFMEKVKRTQAEILQQYAQMLKPGGKMVYATCSIFPSENKEQVNRFLNANPNFKLEDEKVLLPSVSGTDGFYMARIAKE